MVSCSKSRFTRGSINILKLTDSETLEVAIVENVQRDLNVIEEAKGYERLHKEFGYDQDKIANLMSKSRSHISNTLRLLTLPKDVLAMLEQGEISAGQSTTTCWFIKCIIYCRGNCIEKT